MRFWHHFIHPISSHFRKRRAAALLQRYPNLSTMIICDLGGSQHFWQEAGLPIAADRVTILNISQDETAAYGESDFNQIRVVLYDGRHIPAADQSYDLLLCNSVLEHVPPAKRAELCAEMRRVAKRVYVQTPAYEFPMEPHFVLPFLHWLPRRWGRALAWLSPWALLSRPSRQHLENYFNETQLLSKWEMWVLFPDSVLTSERFAGMVKSHLAFWSADSRS